MEFELYILIPAYHIESKGCSIGQITGSDIYQPQAQKAQHESATLLDIERVSKIKILGVVADSAHDRKRIEAFIQRGVRLGLYKDDDPTLTQLVLQRLYIYIYIYISDR